MKRNATWPGFRASRSSAGPFLWPQPPPGSQERQHQAKVHGISWARHRPQTTRSLLLICPGHVLATRSLWPAASSGDSWPPINTSNRKGSEIHTESPDNRQRQEERTLCTPRETLLLSTDTVAKLRLGLESLSEFQAARLLRNWSRWRGRQPASWGLQLFCTMRWYNS